MVILTCSPLTMSEMPFAKSLPIFTVENLTLIPGFEALTRSWNSLLSDSALSVSSLVTRQG